jgi:fatty acid desaturase
MTPAILKSTDQFYWLHLYGHAHTGPLYRELSAYGLPGRLELRRLRPGLWRLTWTGPAGETLTIGEGRQWHMEVRGGEWVMQAQAAADFAAMVLAS